jgi:hypothetical protein
MGLDFKGENEADERVEVSTTPRLREACANTHASDDHNHVRGAYRAITQISTDGFAGDPEQPTSPANLAASQFDRI